MNTQATATSTQTEPTQTEQPCVLVCGGAGFIGSHTTVELLKDGFRVVIADDLSNSSERVLDRIKQIVGNDAFSRLAFCHIDITDKAKLNDVFDRFPISRVIHFAGFKAVGESVEKPIEYYSNNLITTMNLLEVMRAHKLSLIHI